MTEHEDPLEGIRRLASDERRSASWRAWEDVVAGRIDVEAGAARARDEGGASEEEIALAKELFTPLSAEFEAALLERLAVTQTPAPADTAEVRDIASAPRRRPRTTMLWGAGIAAAAAAALALMISRPEVSVPSSPTLGPTLPTHALVLHGVADVRGSEAGPTTFVRGTDTSFELRPATRSNAPRAVAACLVQGDVVVPLAITIDPGRVGDTLSVHAAVPSEAAAGAWEFVGVISSRTGDGAAPGCPVAAESDTVVVRAPVVLR